MDILVSSQDLYKQFPFICMVKEKTTEETVLFTRYTTQLKTYLKDKTTIKRSQYGYITELMIPTSHL